MRFVHKLKARACLSVLAIGVVSACVEVSAIENYQAAKAVFWEQIYPKGHTLYCNKKFTSFWREGINVEHVFPMAWVKNALQCGTRGECRDTSRLFNRIEGDLHNLYPAISDLNYARQSYRFGLIDGERREYGKQCDFEVNKRKRVAEPRAAVRGDVARALLYMEHRYQQEGLKLFNKQAALMLKWHHNDPPSVEEKRRNDVIEKLQGNRNPFIDNPDFAVDYARQRKQKSQQK